MLRHDIQRFQAFTRFIYCNNDQEFLHCLQQAYAEFGIGQALDFGTLTVAWLADDTLPTDWRLALLQQTPCHVEDSNFETSMANKIPNQLRYTHFEWHRADCPFIDGASSFVDHVIAKLFRGKPQPNWFYRQHNLALLLAPLLEPNSRAGLLCLFHRWFKDNIRKNRNFEHKFDTTLGSSLRQWATQLAQGEGEWALVMQWLKDANCNPALLETILSQSDIRPSSDYISPLSGIRLLLLQIRELLLLGENSNAVWVNLVLQHMRNFTYIENQYSALLPNYFSPLVKQLITSDNFWPLCHNDATYSQQQTFKTLFDSFALATYFADSETSFANFVANISDKQLEDLIISTSFAEQYPDLALMFEQQKYNRCQRIIPRLNSAAGLAWYHALLTDSLARGSICFEHVLTHLLEFADANCQHQLIQTYILTDVSARIPNNSLVKRQDAKQLLCYLASDNKYLVEQTIQRLYKLAIVSSDNGEDETTFSRHPDNWPILLTASEKYPEIFIEHFRCLACDDPARWQLLWSGAKEEEQQIKLANEFIYSLDSCEEAKSHEFLALMDRLYLATPAPWLYCLEDLSSDTLLSLLEQISKQETPALALAPAIQAQLNELN